MKYNHIIRVGHEILSSYLSPNSVCADMTLGNGNDSLFLIGRAKFLYAFDIQSESIEKSTLLFQREKISSERYQFILDDHQNVLQHIKEKVDLAVFNLGYLPNSDKAVKTSAETTLTALKNILTIMNANSFILMTFYKHSEGLEEYSLLEEFLQNLDAKSFNIFKFEHINKPLSPTIIGIEIKGII